MERPEAREAPEFSAVWPQLSQRLRRVLHSRRVPADLVDDLVQEAGLRLFRNWAKVDQATVWALANTILLNIVRDEVRKNEVRKRDARLLVTETVRNLDDEVLSHLELRRVERVIRKLSNADQQVLLAEWGEGSEDSFVSPAARKMARMRARQRLRAALEHTSGLVPAWWRLRRATLAKHPPVWSVSQQLSHLATATALAVAGVAGSVAGGVILGGRAAVDAESRRAQTLAASATSSDVRRSRDVLERQRPPGSRIERRDGALTAPASEDAPEAAGLNENFGPVRNDDGDFHVGEGGNGLGPYGAERTVEAAPAGREARARVYAKQEAPKCDDEVVIGRPVNESMPECEPGEGSAGAEAEAEGQEPEAGTP
ncbi:MAG TPA: sigma-70 family RNA polymerase sigma factor [Actinomycetota bacterium]|nr:sigma-70 family RNA polymerase sigma factor [Actinomycetota bacterium]